MHWSVSHCMSAIILQNCELISFKQRLNIFLILARTNIVKNIQALFFFKQLMKLFLQLSFESRTNCKSTYTLYWGKVVKLICTCNVIALELSHFDQAYKIGIAGPSNFLRNRLGPFLYLLNERKYEAAIYTLY